jgi:hypothetical protein
MSKPIGFAMEAGTSALDDAERVTLGAAIASRVRTGWLAEVEFVFTTGAATGFVGVGFGFGFVGVDEATGGWGFVGSGFVVPIGCGGLVAGFFGSGCVG